MEEKKKNHFLLNFFIILVMLVLGLYLYARYIEPTRFIVKEYRISNVNIPKSFSGVKIVQISDIYFGNTTHIEDLNKIVDRINMLNPDIVLFTGNLFGNKLKKEKELTEVLSNIKATLGKYAVKGNKDYVNEFESIITAAGFNILNNEYELIYNESNNPIYICGLSSYLKEKVSLDKCLEPFMVPDNTVNYYKILMINEGDASNEILKSTLQPNLILAGNSLNGTIVLPYYGSLFIPKGSKNYFSEHYKRSSTDIYISSGVGTNEYSYRLFNPPSINLFRLKSLQ